MISSIIYCIIFLGVYTWAQISTSCKEFLNKNINSVNSCILLLFFIIRAALDSLYYFAVENDPSINLNGSLFAQIAVFIQSIFSRAKCFVLYYLVCLAEDAKIKIKYDQLGEEIDNNEKKKWERRKILCFSVYLTVAVMIVISTVL